jgi:hypothetical protein
MKQRLSVRNLQKKLFIHTSWISFSAEIRQNWLEWSKFVGMGRNFFQGGIGGLLVPICMLVRDFPVIPAEMERN